VFAASLFQGAVTGSGLPAACLLSGRGL